MKMFEAPPPAAAKRPGVTVDQSSGPGCPARRVDGLSIIASGYVDRGDDSLDINLQTESPVFLQKDTFRSVFYVLGKRGSRVDGLFLRREEDCAIPSRPD